MAEDDALMDIDDDALARLVDRFYARVRKDEGLGPVFNDAIDDWPAHLVKLAAFWSSVMLRTGKYRGQPLPAHMRHKHRISPELFNRWLTLWRQTTNELMTPEAAAALQDRAERIGENMQYAIFYRQEQHHAL